MADQPSTTRTRKPPTQDAPADGPDLGDAPAETPASDDQGAAGVTLTPDELAELLANTAAQAAEDAVAAMARERAAAPVESTLVAASAQAPVAVGTPPDEPTYEPEFIPGPDDFAEAAAAEEKGIVHPEPIAQAATILVNGPQGDSVECTPKVFRMILAPLGYAAHPEDAARHQQRPAVRRRRGSDLDGQAPSSAAQRRRRRQ